MRFICYCMRDSTNIPFLKVDLYAEHIFDKARNSSPKFNRVYEDSLTDPRSYEEIHSIRFGAITRIDFIYTTIGELVPYWRGEVIDSKYA